MRITESELRKEVRSVLKEGKAEFLNALKDIEFDAKRKDPGITNKQKMVKRAWFANADHQFFKKLVKVHWLSPRTRKGTPGDIVDRVKWFFESSGKNEMSCSAYLPGGNLVSAWGNIGVMIEGTVTLAATDMNSVNSGYHGDADKQKYKSSGVPRRPGHFDADYAEDYALDSASFESQEKRYKDNEVIVDHWKAKGLVLGEYFRYQISLKDLKRLQLYCSESGIPIVYAKNPV